MLADAHGLNFSVYDESFFIAFDFVKTDPVKLSAAPHGCSATVGVPENELQDLQALNQAFGGQMTAGNANQGQGHGLTLQTVTLGCEEVMIAPGPDSTDRAPMFHPRALSTMKLYRSFVTVGGLTLVSRVLGFVRSILFAWAFGAGWVADAFNVAFRFPNLFRAPVRRGRIQLGVPAAVRQGARAQRPRSGAPLRRGERCRGSFFVLLILTVVCIVAMPWLMYGLAPGFSDRSEEVRPRGAAVADHVPVPALHVARRALLRACSTRSASSSKARRSLSFST